MITNYIAVGVDGSVAARSALLWAADECRIRRRTLLIVHAPDANEVLMMAGHHSGPAFRSLDDVGEHVLRDHASAASARQPSVLVTTQLSRRPPGETLIGLSGDADLLVVGSSGHGGAAVANVLGSVSDRVAAHAHCPVTVVPVRRPGRTSPARVVVGVSPTVSGRLALEFALEEARLRGATLVALSALRDQHLGSGPGHIPDDRALRTGAVLFDELESVGAAYPDVTVEPTLADAEPASALLDAARDAQLVVVGCHHTDDRWSTRLGPVPSVIAHQCPCAVVVVGQRRHVPDATAALPATDFA